MCHKKQIELKYLNWHILCKHYNKVHQQFRFLYELKNKTLSNGFQSYGIIYKKIREPLRAFGRSPEIDADKLVLD